MRQVPCHAAIEFLPVYVLPIAFLFLLRLILMLFWQERLMLIEILHLVISPLRKPDKQGTQYFYNTDVRFYMSVVVSFAAR